MKKNKIIIVALLSLFLTACFTDKGNYSYTKTKEINVKCKQGKYIVVSGEEVVLEPLLKYSGNDTNPVPEVTYEWVLNNEVVSTEKNFKYKAGNKLELLTGYLKVRDVKTGEQYSGSFKISVESAYKTGYTILHENEDGVGEISFIRGIVVDKNNNDSVIYTNEYANIYELANGRPMLENHVSITEHSVSSENYSAYTEITLITEGGNFIEDINGGSFARETKLQDEFVNELLPDNFSPKQVVHTPWDSYLISKDNLMYARRASDGELFHTGRYNAKFTFNDDTKYSDILPTFVPRSNALLAIEYDAEGKRNYTAIICETYDPDDNGAIVPIIADEGNVKLLNDFKDVKYEILASDYILYGHDKDGLIAQSLLVKKDGNYCLHNMVLRSNSNASYSAIKSSFVELDKIVGKKPVLGMATIKMKDLVIFYDENNVYVYDWEKNNTTILFTSTKKISALALHSKIRGYYSTSSGQSESASFAIGYETGEVEIYELKRNLTEIEKLIFASKNKYGKIKQIMYKYGTAELFYNLI